MSERNDFDAIEARIATALSTMGPQDFQLDDPPDDVWSAIERATTPAAPSRPARLPPRWLAVAAAAVVMVLAGGALLLRSSGGSGVIAEAALSSEGLSGAPAGLTGTAKVRERDGHRVLVIEAGDVSARSGEYLELWLIDGGVEKMVSLGTINGPGEYRIPDGLDVSEYVLVDISTEPFDGKPAHSGASLLRGRLV